MSDETFGGVTRKKKFGGFLFSFGGFSKIEEKSDNGFGDEYASEDSCKNVVIYDFVGSGEIDNDVSNKKNDGSENFGTENVGKCGVVGFFGAGFTKSVMVKTSKKSRI